MRSAVAIALIVGALTITSESVSATPLAFGDHAALSRDMSAAVMQVAHRHAYAQDLCHRI
jgi:hypothetical protein